VTMLFKMEVVILSGPKNPRIFFETSQPSFAQERKKRKRTTP
jgi:hypothetical protein